MTTKATDAVQLRADVEGLVTTKDTHGTLTEKEDESRILSPALLRMPATGIADVRTGACRTEGGDDLGVAVTAHFLSRP
jgi:hypothetical protein